MSKLTKKEALSYLGLDEKTFTNYFKNAGEFPCLKEGGRYFFDKDILTRWKDNYEWRTVELTLEDYALCLDFMLAMHFRGYVLVDWGTARQREFGQRLTNWMKGQLAEIAVKKFLKREFDVDVELDFQIREKIVPQDIIGIIKRGKMRNPKIKVGIKSSKPKSAFLVLGENEVDRPERRSDAYIFCRPNIPDEHILRITKEKIIKLVKDKPHYSKYKEEIKPFENMLCEIAGYCWTNELEGPVNHIPGQEFDGNRYVKKTGVLHRSRAKWRELLKRL